MITTEELWLEAQCQVLGSCFLSEDAAKKVVAQTTDNDYRDTQLDVFRTIREMVARDEPISGLGVANRIGPHLFQTIKDMIALTPTAVTVDYYIRYLRQQSQGERLRRIAQKMALADESESRKELMLSWQQVLDESEPVKIKTMEQVLEEFGSFCTREPKYLPWHLPELDRVIFAEPGDFLVIGGYPSSGKSAFALQCADLWAREYKVGFFSLETSTQKLLHRMLANRFSIPLREIKNRAVNSKDWDRLMDGTEEVQNLNLELIEAAGMRVADILAISRQRKFEVVIIDYLQLIRGDGASRYEQVSAISRDLQTMAKTTGITVVALSQLRRNDYGNAAPGMSDLRESGQIEQDADLIALLYKADSRGESQDRILKIAKNKEGECATFRLAFSGDYQRFTLAAPAPQEQPRGRRRSAMETYERGRY